MLFTKPYWRKICSDGATELLPMGIQLLVTELRKFYNQDPECFSLVLGIVRGEFKNQSTEVKVLNIEEFEKAYPNQ